MATTPIQYNTYNPSSQYNYTNPRNAAISGQQAIASQGQQLYNQNNQMLNQGQQQLGQTQGYLNNIEDPLAQGQGGYTQAEQQQIELTPEQQQNIVTGAGISAGANTAAATQAADQQFNATGGNPAAMAAYRNREAQQQGAQAGNAMTQAKIGAQQAGAAGAEAVGNAAIGQQNQALGYYGGLQQQQNQNVQNAAQRNQQTYQTATQGQNSATANAINASQTPTTADKVIGAVSGFLEDGGEALGHEAVVAEGNNPERIVSSNYSRQSSQGQPGMMEDGWDVNSPDASDAPPASAPPNAAAAPSMAPATPWWQKVGQAMKSNIGQGGGGQQPMGGGGMGRSGGFNPVQPYSSLGAGIGRIASAFNLEDGGIMPSFQEDGAYMANGGGMRPVREIVPGPIARPFRPDAPIAPQGTNGIFTRPTKVNLQPGDKVVPLTHRPYAKVRPSAAFGQSGVGM